MKKTIMLIALAMIAGQAQASPLIYTCKDQGKKLPLTVEEDKNILTWKGTAYKIATTDCGRAGWHAEKDGVSFDFCTATKGVADFELNGVTIDCDLKR